MLRLVAYRPDGVSRLPLIQGEQLVGSSEQCEIFLPFPGIAARHARFRRDEEGLEIEAIGQAPALLVNGSAVRRSTLEVLDEVRLGNVVLLVEDTDDVLPEALTARQQSREENGPPVVNPRSLLDWLSRLSGWVLSDSESRASLESLLLDLLVDFGGGAFFLFEGSLAEAQPAVRLSVVTEESWLRAGEEVVEALRSHARPGPGRSIGGFFSEVAGRPVWISYRFLSALERNYFMVVALPEFQPEEWSPELGLAAVGDLLVLGLVHHVGRYEPILPGRDGGRDLVLAPGFVGGPSAAIQEHLAQLKSVADSACNVFLFGEPGSGKELSARTLHLSGSRCNGPFVVARCDGTNESLLEADLFGAEIRGRTVPVRREGKVTLADGGTLYLDRVDRLPLALQARMVRLLRSGVLEGPGDGERKVLDVRIAAGSPIELRTLVASDLFRVDLAYLIGQLGMAVPALRERREDLPLLLQTSVNRFSHETGKRVRGITVAALSALSSYPFPGNLRELENVVRQMVYFATDREPMDTDLLPPEIRTSTVISDGRIDEHAPVLSLAELVGNVEQAAIREALRRTLGNKSRAAKLLGISRNGLAKKMERLGVD